MFSDVTGSAQIGERLDPETLRRVMERYFDRMKVELERHGGTVEKFIGDAVMAVFGIPAPTKMMLCVPYEPPWTCDGFASSSTSI